MAEILSDDQVASHWFFQFFYLLFAPFSIFFHTMRFVGLENLPPKGEGALLVNFHTTHNQDICSLGGILYARTGRIVRGLYHRTLFTFTPWLKYLGGVAGQRNTARDLLASGHIVGVIPGGAEEALRGHENSYAIQWESSTGHQRTGFAEVVLSVGKPVKVIPIFAKNCEEMRWNPIHWLCNLIGLSRLWHHLQQYLIRNKYPDWIEKTLFMIGALMWYPTSFWAIPIPVEVTVYVGKPIIADPSKDKAIDIVQRVKAAMEDLICTHQPYAPAKCYSHALKERFWLQYTPSKARGNTRFVE